MGKDRENTFHPGKDKPSGTNKSEPEIPADLPARHPNRNTSKGDNSKTESSQNKSRNAAFTEEVTKTQPEELSGILTKDIFAELAAYDQAPCISILLATHKAGVEVNEQVDQTAFKNALQQAEKALKEKGTDQLLIKRILTPAYDLLREESFWYTMTEGLAIYLADGFFKYLKVRAPLVDHVRVNSAFCVNPLVPFMVRPEYFYLLDIAKKFPRFYRVDAFGIEQLKVEEMPTGVDDVVHLEEKDGNNTFRAGDSGSRPSGSSHGQGGLRPGDKEYVSKYLDEVDDTIWQSHLNQENVPLVLAGQDHLLPIYRSVSDYKNIWPEALTGNHHQQSDQELYEEVMQLMKPFFDQKQQRALEEYGNKTMTPLTCSMPNDIIPAAYYGRIDTLFVRKGHSMWGSFNEADNKLEVLDSETEHADDLIDKAVLKTLQNGGTVYMLDGDQMPNNNEIAAIFRY